LENIKKDSLSNEEQQIVNKFCEGLAVPNLATVNEFRKSLKELKFKNIKFVDITKNVMPSSKKLYYGCMLSFPLVKALEFFKITPKMLTDNLISGINQYYGIKRKIGCYGIFYAEK